MGPELILVGAENADIPAVRRQGHRVLFFHAYPHQYAGAQRITHMLAQRLAALGAEVLVVLPAPGPFMERLRADGVTVAVLGAPHAWRRYGGALAGARGLPAAALLPAYWVRLAMFIHRWRPTIVHCNDHRGMLLAGPAARIARVPLVWHVHGTYDSDAINRLGATLAQRILVVSQATLQEMPALSRYGGALVSILPNGIPAVTAPTAEQVAAAWPRDTSPRLACMARINPEKGLDVLIRAAARLRADHPSLSVAIMGGVQQGYEDYATDLRRLIGDLELGEHVLLTGFLSDPAPLLAGADVYIQPSRAEPFGLGVLEAMAFGVPVVATRVGGMAEIVRDGVDGLQVDADDVEGLAAILDRVIGDSALSTRLGAGGRCRVRDDFSEDTMVKRLVQAYDAAVKA